MTRLHVRIFPLLKGTVALSPPLSSQTWFQDGRIGKRFQSDKKIQTMNDVRSTLNKWMDTRVGWAPKPRDRSHLLRFLPKYQDDLPPRSIKISNDSLVGQDSFGEAIIPLSKELKLQERYVTATGKLRMGRVIEDMDLFAVYIALKYIKNPLQGEGLPTPYVIVTAAVDDIEYVFEKPDVRKDVKISGMVIDVGHSSLNIRVQLEKMGEATDWSKLAIANFKMAARNSTLTGPAFINRLKLDGPDEEKLNKEAIEQKLLKKQGDKLSLLHNPPTAEEQNLIHQNFIKSVDLRDPSINKRILPQGHVWMEDTKLNTCIFPHPENRNHHNTVFGGYLMRRALELAWMTAYTYSVQRPSLRYISNISFKKPVLISSFLKIMSQVVFTYENYMQIAVFIELYDVTTQEVLTTNSFHITYEVTNAVKPIMPKTYHEAILWLNGRREMKKWKQGL